MIISKVDRMDLYEALNRTNRKFGNNVDFWKLDSKNRWDNRWSVRLFTYRKTGLGVKRLSPYRMEQNNFYQAPILWACWHVHGEFFNNLLEINPTARIRSGVWYSDSEKSITKENWIWEPVDLEKQTGGREALREYGFQAVGGRIRADYNRSWCFCLGDDYFFSRWIRKEFTN